MLDPVSEGLCRVEHWTGETPAGEKEQPMGQCPHLLRKEKRLLWPGWAEAGEKPSGKAVPTSNRLGEKTKPRLSLH